jgi:hypothetical protein
MMRSDDPLPQNVIRFPEGFERFFRATEARWQEIEAVFQCDDLEQQQKRIEQAGCKFFFDLGDPDEEGRKAPAGKAKSK